MQGVTKCYRLGEVGAGSLRGDLHSRLARLRGREDPDAPLRRAEREGEILRALDGVELTVRRGETVGVIGSSGAGKSTLLKLLSRITVPTEGEIDLYGRVSAVLEAGAGFSGRLTGRENVQCPFCGAMFLPQMLYRDLK
jgi:lipopolysaccharide transport system ATP-binding protein